MATITRFAPSPSGSLHLGGARTALFNYLHAKRNNGIFKLRIEDTDKSRSTIESSNLIIESLKWLNLEFENEIVYQSQNIGEHKDVAFSLLSKGLAYKCFHDKSFLEKHKPSNKKFISEWRNKQNNLPKNKSYCIRIKSPISGSYILKDSIQGKVKVNFDEIDDYVILRDDGTPTFLLSSATDDLSMKITDIIRGDDHLTNSFRQKIIFDFLDYKPKFHHISLLHNEQNQKMSKRDNTPSILKYKDNGYLPEAIINYLVRLGWSYGDQEIFSANEIKEKFSIEKVGKSPAKFDEKKLNFLNSHYIKQKNNDEILKYLENNDNLYFKRRNLSKNNIDILLELYKERVKSLGELSESLSNIYNGNFKFSDEQIVIIQEFDKFKDLILSKLSDIVSWNSVDIEKKISEVILDEKLTFKKVIQPLRLLVTGSISGPSIFKIIEVIGHEETLNRIKKVDI